MTWSSDFIGVRRWKALSAITGLGNKGIINKEREKASKAMKNSEVAKVFQDIADLLELKRENVFKIRAYQKAVRAIEHHPKELKIMIDEGMDLQSIPAWVRQ